MVSKLATVTTTARRALGQAHHFILGVTSPIFNACVTYCCSLVNKCEDGVTVNGINMSVCPCVGHVWEAQHVLNVFSDMDVLNEHYAIDVRLS